MSTIIELRPLSAESAGILLADSAALWPAEADDSALLWYNDRTVVEVFASCPAVRRVLLHGGEPVLPNEERGGPYRVLEPAGVQQFHQLLTAVDAAAVQATCARIAAETRAGWDQLGLFEDQEFTAAHVNILPELRKFVAAAAGQGRALLLYWGQ